MDLLLLAARALGPVIRRFISLGLNRVWLKAGDVAYKYAHTYSHSISYTLHICKPSISFILPLNRDLCWKVLVQCFFHATTFLRQIGRDVVGRRASAGTLHG